MIIGCGTVWGGAIVAILIALAVEKKNNLSKASEMAVKE